MSFRLDVARYHKPLSVGIFGGGTLALLIASAVALLGGNTGLGIGLGMQTIAEVAQARLVPPGDRRNAMGDLTTIRHDGKNLFAGLPSPFDALRDPNPSLIVDPRKPGSQLEVSAWDERSGVVGCRAWALAMEGVQVDTRWFSTRLGNDMLFIFLYQSQAW